ncbi:MAG: hypothetical protein ACRDNS_33075, partial [Trebonia sp.]
MSTPPSAPGPLTVAGRRRLHLPVVLVCSLTLAACTASHPAPPASSPAQTAAVASRPAGGGPAGEASTPSPSASAAQPTSGAAVTATTIATRLPRALSRLVAVPLGGRHHVDSADRSSA